MLGLIERTYLRYVDSSPAEECQNGCPADRNAPRAQLAAQLGAARPATPVTLININSPRSTKLAKQTHQAPKERGRAADPLILLITIWTQLTASWLLGGHLERHGRALGFQSGPRLRDHDDPA
jgi:hypothetical protein